MSTSPFENRNLLPRPGRPAWPLILALAAIVVVPLVIWELPREKERWKVARAVQMRVDGKLNEGLQVLDEVLEDDPKNVAALLLRAEWQMQDSQADRALADLDQAVAILPDDRELLSIRARVLLKTGRYKEAIRDANGAQLSVPTSDKLQRAISLNEVAYYRAIGNQDLQRAKEEIDEALSILPKSISQAGMLDTRGFILYRLQRYEDALKDINAAIPEADEMIAELETLKTRISRRGRDFEQVAKQYRRNAAVIYYHRGLIYEALGEKSKAEADFAKVREWGCEPNEELY